MKRVKNVDVVENFIWHREPVQNHGETLFINGNRLISYNTTIAEFVDGKLVVNDTRYSVTTSKIQSKVRSIAPSYIETTKNVPMGTASLIEYI